MADRISRRALFAFAGSFIAAATGFALGAAGQTHSGGSGSAGRGSAGRGGSDGGHESDDEHTHDDRTHEEGDDGHDDRVEHGGKGKGPKYRGGRDVSQIGSHGAGRSLEDRVLRKD